ncbi:MAG: NYN domain-containing protein [Deltaproteobacteria bacterium]
MNIIVDGYNLIRQSIPLRSAEKISLEAGRRALLVALDAYQQQKRHQITVVFDGWEGGTPQEERDVFKDINIIYSKLGEKADEVIKRIVAQGSDNFTVISSDRDIANYVIRRGYSAISSLDFEHRLYSLSEYDSCFDDDVDESEDTTLARQINTKKKGTAHKLSRAKRKERQALESL